MKAIIVEQREEEPLLVWEDVADIRHSSEEVLVDVKATAVNRADLLQAKGLYPPPPGESEILGLEMAGVVSAIGEGVKGWQPGDRVLSLLCGGGYAQQAAVDHHMLIRLPDNWSFTQGAAVPEVWLTAFINLFWEGNLKTGETLLIHAGASGVGTAGIQLARETETVICVTAGSEAKLSRCRDLGAAVTINYKEQDYHEAVLNRTGGKGVDLILDPIGGTYLERNLKLLKENGRLVSIGLLGGASAELNLGLVLGKSLRISGSRLRSRPLSEKVRLTRAFEEQFWSKLKNGILEPVVDCVFPIQEAQAAHQYVQQNKNIGKVILEVDASP